MTLWVLKSQILNQKEKQFMDNLTDIYLMLNELQLCIKIIDSKINRIELMLNSSQ